MRKDTKKSCQGESFFFLFVLLFYLYFSEENLKRKFKRKIQRSNSIDYYKITKLLLNTLMNKSYQNNLNKKNHIPHGLFTIFWIIFSHQNQIRIPNPNVISIWILNVFISLTFWDLTPCFCLEKKILNKCIELFKFVWISLSYLYIKKGDGLKDVYFIYTFRYRIYGWPFLYRYGGWTKQK